MRARYRAGETLAVKHERVLGGRPCSQRCRGVAHCVRHTSSFGAIGHHCGDDRWMPCSPVEAPTFFRQGAAGRSMRSRRPLAGSGQEEFRVAHGSDARSRGALLGQRRWRHPGGPLRCLDGEPAHTLRIGLTEINAPEKRQAFGAAPPDAAAPPPPGRDYCSSFLAPDWHHQIQHEMQRTPILAPAACKKCWWALSDSNTRPTD